MRRGSAQIVDPDLVDVPGLAVPIVARDDESLRPSRSMSAMAGTAPDPILETGLRSSVVPFALRTTMSPALPLLGSASATTSGRWSPSRSPTTGLAFFSQRLVPSVTGQPGTAVPSPRHASTAISVWRMISGTPSPLRSPSAGAVP